MSVRYKPDTARYPVRFDCESERCMRDGFIAVAQEIMAASDDYTKNGQQLLAGMELEFPLVTAELQLMPQTVRDRIVNAFPSCTSVELAAHQLEVVTDPPVDLYAHGVGRLEQSMRASLANIAQLAAQDKVHCVRIGSFPLAPIAAVAYTQGADKYAKYRRSPTWHMDHQRLNACPVLQGAEPLDVSNAYVVGLMNSVQISVDSLNVKDAIDKLNRSFMISPWATALGGNARYLDLYDTGYSDMRFVVWDISHDSRSEEEVKQNQSTRVGLPQRYFRGLADYFNHILSYPFVMDDPVSLQHPFEVGNGISWRDARLKFFRDKKTIAVEFRPVALQPSLHEDVAMMAFYLGRLKWSQATKEDLLPMQNVIDNKQQVMRHGLHAQVHYQEGHTVLSGNVRQLLERELDRSEEGLRSMGTSSAEAAGYIATLRKRLDTGNPSESFAALVMRHEAKNRVRVRQERREVLVAALTEANLVLPLS